LVGIYGVSRRDAADILRDPFSVPISVGAVGGVVRCQKVAASALAKPYEEAVAEVPNAPVKNADETG